MPTGPPPERRSSNWADPLFVGVLAVLFLAFFVVRSQIELKRPVPWPDEGSFVWQALAFRDHASLFAPEVHPGRDVLWMPPGYMVVVGTIFKILPFSLNAVRSLSALFLCGAFACLAASVRHFRSALGLLPVFGVFLFSPILLVVGNVARMESLVLFASMAGFLLLSNRKPVGLAVLALAPLVHPNGLFACLGGLVYFVATFSERRTTSGRDRLVFALVGVAWALYGAYVGTHLPAFLEDMGNQLRFKEFISSEEGGAGARVRMPLVVVPVLLLGLAARFSRRIRTETGGISVLSAVFFVQAVLASGWLYEAYVVFALLLVTIVVVETTTALVALSISAPRVRLLALFSASAVATLVGRFVVDTPFAKRSLARTTVDRPTLDPVYFTPGDHAAVASVLKRLERDLGSISVQFIPDGEALLFEKLRSKTLRFTQQTFFPGYFNVVIVHQSAWSPPVAHGLVLMHVLTMNPGRPETTVFRVRDATEQFMAVRFRDVADGVPGPRDEAAVLSPDHPDAEPP